MKTKTYKPRFDYFPYLTLQYLKEHGESKNENIREEITLNEWCKYSDYSDRSKYYFGGVIIPRLIGHGLIVRTKLGYYILTPKGYNLMNQS